MLEKTLNNHIIGLKCKECGRRYPETALHVCEFCFGPLEVEYDYDVIRDRVSRAGIEAGPRSMWRYKAFLPVQPDDQPVDIGAGLTPLVKAKNLADALGLKNLYLKNDCVNPTYSFKDRPVSVASTKALEFGFDVLSCASTGNLAGSVAAHAARAGVRSYIFIPANLEAGKVLGAAVYDPVLVAVDGNYDQVNRLCSEIADRYHWAFVNINMRPYYAEGSKTLAFEVAEQLGWRAPDHVVIPVASGSMFSKIWKGFSELAEVGLIDQRLPRMSAAQALGCSPIATAYFNNTLNVKPVIPDTIAKSLAIGNPADGYYDLQIIKESDGAAEVATDQEIVDGIKLLAQTEGIFAETAGGVTIACLKKLVQAGKVGRDEVTVAYITGNGLKTQEAVEEHLSPSLQVGPTLSSFEDQLERRKGSDKRVAELAGARG
ncbi:MAG TPA: threonine synthase [Chloroflexota bacterium]|nr:threonine synthase [Chloroflexota bacterium]